MMMPSGSSPITSRPTRSWMKSVGLVGFGSSRHVKKPGSPPTSPLPPSSTIRSCPTESRDFPWPVMSLRANAARRTLPGDTVRLPSTVASPPLTSWRGRARGVHTDDDAWLTELEIGCAVVGVATSSSCAQGRALGVVDPERRMDAPRGAPRRRWPDRTQRRKRPPRHSERPRWRSSNRRVGHRFRHRDHCNSELGHMDRVVDAAADQGCSYQRAPLLRSVDCSGSGLGEHRNDPDTGNGGHHSERRHPRRTGSSAGISGGVSRDTLRQPWGELLYPRRAIRLAVLGEYLTSQF